MSVNEHPNPLLQTAQTVTLRRLDDMFSPIRPYIHLAGALPIRVDGTNDLIQQSLFLIEQRVPVEARKRVRSVGEEPQSIRSRRRRSIQHRLHHNEEPQRRDERGHPGGRAARRRLNDPALGDKFVIDRTRLGHIAVPQPDQRRSPKRRTDLLVPDVDRPERPPPDFVFDWVEAVVCLDRAVESRIKGERDRLCQERESLREVPKADSIDGGDEDALDCVERRPVRGWETSKTCEELEPVRATRERVGGFGANARVVRVSGGEAADSNYEARESRLAPFCGVPVVV